MRGLYDERRTEGRGEEEEEEEEEEESKIQIMMSLNETREQDDFLVIHFLFYSTSLCQNTYSSVYVICYFFKSLYTHTHTVRLISV